MDHHCLWIQRCVAYHNHRPFLQFIFYQSLGYIGYWYHNSYVFEGIYGSCHFWTTFDFNVYLIWGLTNLTMAVLGTLIFFLFVFQTWMISCNFTTMDGVKIGAKCPLPICEVRPNWNKRVNVENVHFSQFR